jgi:hypothetical protein
MNNRNFEIKENHIAVFDNFFSDSFIEDCLKYFKLHEDSNLTYDRLKNEGVYAHIKNDTSIDVRHTFMNNFSNYFFKDIYPLYLKKYSWLNECKFHTIYETKIQKTKPAEGYHVWHAEKDGMINSYRIMSFILYLNDIKKGGETEFLYQKERIEAKRNRLILFPSAYTHVHRGNPPLEEDKYIFTGWIEFGVR